MIVAIPTIKERGDAWQEVAAAFYATSPPDTVCVPSWKEGGWAGGLNEVWESHKDADIFVCGSDDMFPEQGWYEAMLPYLDQGIIAPQVKDPRFNRWDVNTRDGEVTRMSTFPIIPNRALRIIFPLPDGLHYYADDLISDRARHLDIPTVAVPSCVIVHMMDDRGRGAGMGDESTRMAYDRAIYDSLTD